MELPLTENERVLLQEVLSSAYRDLRMEVVGTDDVAYRRALQSREQVLKTLLDRVGGLLDLA